MGPKPTFYVLKRHFILTPDTANPSNPTKSDTDPNPDDGGPVEMEDEMLAKEFLGSIVPDHEQPGRQRIHISGDNEAAPVLTFPWQKTEFNSLRGKLSEERSLSLMAKAVNLLNARIGVSRSAVAEYDGKQVTYFFLTEPDEAFDRVKRDPNVSTKVNEWLTTRGKDRVWFIVGFMIAREVDLTDMGNAQKTATVEAEIPAPLPPGGLPIPLTAMEGGAEINAKQGAEGLATPKGRAIFAVEYLGIRQLPRWRGGRAPVTAHGPHDAARTFGPDGEDDEAQKFGGEENPVEICLGSDPLTKVLRLTGKDVVEEDFDEGYAFVYDQDEKSVEGSDAEALLQGDEWDDDG